MEGLGELFKNAVLAIVKDNYITAFSYSAFMHNAVYLWTSYKPLITAPLSIRFLEAYRALKSEGLILFWNAYLTTVVTKEQYTTILDHLNLTYFENEKGVYLNATSS